MLPPAPGVQPGISRLQDAWFNTDTYFVHVFNSGSVSKICLTPLPFFSTGMMMPSADYSKALGSDTNGYAILHQQPSFINPNFSAISSSTGKRFEVFFFSKILGSVEEIYERRIELNYLCLYVVVRFFTLSTPTNFNSVWIEHSSCCLLLRFLPHSTYLSQYSRPSHANVPRSHSFQQRRSN